MIINYAFIPSRFMCLYDPKNKTYLFNFVYKSYEKLFLKIVECIKVTHWCIKNVFPLCFGSYRPIKT